MGHNYLTYQTWGLLAPGLFLGMAMGFTFSLLFYVKFFQWFRTLGEKFHTLIGKKFLHQLLLSAMKIMYAHDVDEQKETGNISIYGRRVGPTGQYLQFASIVIVFACSAMAFWIKFLIDESDHCDPRMDCFTSCVLAPNGLPRPLSPENCTYYEKDCIIKCFTFAFQYADALGNSGGVLILSKVVASIHATVWIGIASRSSQPRAKWQRTHAIFYIISSLIIVVFFWEVVLFVPSLRSLISGLKKGIEFWAYTYAFTTVFLVSGPVFILTTQPLEDDNERTAEDDNERTVEDDIERTGLLGQVNLHYSSETEN